MPKDVAYDPEVIRTSVRQIYADARILEIAYAAGGAFFLGSTTFSWFQLVHLLSSLTSLSGLLKSQPPSPIGFGAVFVSLLFAAAGAAAGYRLARVKGAQLRLRAQVALCQLHIEEKLGR